MNFADSGLAAATAYYYKVEATDAFGNSAASTVASAKTAASTKASGAGCHINYTVSSSWSTGFQAAITISNTGSTNLTSWTLQWTFPQKQQVTSVWNATESERGEAVTLKSLSYNGAIAAGGNVTGIGFTANVSGTNSAPTAFTLNGVTCK
jgi:cellulose 1,4-beta-cellobiosidase